MNDVQFRIMLMTRAGGNEGRLLQDMTDAFARIAEHDKSTPMSYPYLTSIASFLERIGWLHRSKSGVNVVYYITELGDLELDKEIAIRSNDSNNNNIGLRKFTS